MARVILRPGVPARGQYNPSEQPEPFTPNPVGAGGPIQATLSPQQQSQNPSQPGINQSIYLTNAQPVQQNVTTTQGQNITVQFAPITTANGTKYVPQSIVKNATFAAPINTQSNNYSATGNATYTYAIQNGNIVTQQTTSTGAITYTANPVEYSAALKALQTAKETQASAIQQETQYSNLLNTTNFNNLSPQAATATYSAYATAFKNAQASYFSSLGDITSAQANVNKYAPTTIANIQNGNIVLTGATVPEYLSGNIQGTTQNLGTLTLTPTLVNGSINLGTTSFTPALVTIGGNGASAGLYTQYNAATNTIGFNPSDYGYLEAHNAQSVTKNGATYVYGATFPAQFNLAQTFYGSLAYANVTGGLVSAKNIPVTGTIQVPGGAAPYSLFENYSALTGYSFSKTPSDITVTTGAGLITTVLVPSIDTVAGAVTFTGTTTQIIPGSTIGPTINTGSVPSAFNLGGNSLKTAQNFNLNIITPSEINGAKATVSTNTIEPFAANSGLIVGGGGSLFSKKIEPNIQPEIDAYMTFIEPLTTFYSKYITPSFQPGTIPILLPHGQGIVSAPNPLFANPVLAPVLTFGTGVSYGVVSLPLQFAELPATTLETVVHPIATATSVYKQAATNPLFFAGSFVGSAIATYGISKVVGLFTSGVNNVEITAFQDINKNPELANVKLDVLGISEGSTNLARQGTSDVSFTTYSKGYGPFSKSFIAVTQSTGESFTGTAGGLSITNAGTVTDIYKLTDDLQIGKLVKAGITSKDFSVTLGIPYELPASEAGPEAVSASKLPGGPSYSLPAQSESIIEPVTTQLALPKTSEPLFTQGTALDIQNNPITKSTIESGGPKAEPGINIVGATSNGQPFQFLTGKATVTEYALGKQLSDLPAVSKLDILENAKTGATSQFDIAIIKPTSAGVGVSQAVDVNGESFILTKGVALQNDVNGLIKFTSLSRETDLTTISNLPAVVESPKGMTFISMPRTALSPGLYGLPAPGAGSYSTILGVQSAQPPQASPFAVQPRSFSSGAITSLGSSLQSTSSGIIGGTSSGGSTIQVEKVIPPTIGPTKGGGFIQIPKPRQEQFTNPPPGNQGTTILKPATKVFRINSPILAPISTSGTTVGLFNIMNTNTKSSVKNTLTPFQSQAPGNINTGVTTTKVIQIPKVTQVTVQIPGRITTQIQPQPQLTTTVQERPNPRFNLPGFNSQFTLNLYPEKLKPQPIKRQVATARVNPRFGYVPDLTHALLNIHGEKTLFGLSRPVASRRKK